MNGRLVSLLAGAALIAASGTASACGDGPSLLSDSFDELQPVWGSSDEYMSVAGGKMVISEKDGSFYVVMAEPSFDEVDFCASVTLSQGTDLAGSYGGIVFWAEDLKNFYTLQITLDGYATVYQYVDGNWQSLVDDKIAASVRQGTGAKNELRVVTRGAKAVLSINGTVFAAIDGTPPPSGQQIGFTAEAPADGAASFDFDDVTVNEPSPE